MSKKKLGRGYARWVNISKEERSKEMSRIARILWRKIKNGQFDKAK